MIIYTNLVLKGLDDSEVMTKTHYTSTLVSWESKRQETVVLSTVETEYIVFIQVMTQALWLTKYFDKIGLALLPIIIHVNNDSSTSNSLNNKNHCHTKHIDVKHHFVKKCTKLGQVLFTYILSSENTADMFIKLLA